MYFIQEKYEQATSCYEKTLELSPDFVYAWKSAIYCYYKTGRHEKTIEEGHKLIQQHGPDLRIVKTIGDAHFEQNEFESAIEAYIFMTQINAESIFIRPPCCHRRRTRTRLAHLPGKTYTSTGRVGFSSRLNGSKKLIFAYTQGNPEEGKFQPYFEHMEKLFSFLHYDVQGTLVANGTRQHNDIRSNEEILAKSRMAGAELAVYKVKTSIELNITK